MMTPDDLKQIAGLLEQLEIRIEKRFEHLDQKIDRVYDDLSQKIDQTRDQIIRDVAEHMADSVLPLLDKYDKRLEHLEGHTSHPPGAPVNS